MEDGPPVPNHPDPPGGNWLTASPSAARTRGSSRAGGPSTSVLLTPTPSPLPPSQSIDRPTVSGLTAFEAGKRRKRQATAGPDDRPGRANPVYLGTPRSTRFKNLFPDAPSAPGILEVTKKLYDLIEGLIHLPKKGAEKITLGSESAADIKTLAAHLLELAETLSDIPSIRRNPFSDAGDAHQVERALAGTNSFGCEVPKSIEAKLDKLAKDLAEMKQAVVMPTSTFSFNTSNSRPGIPSYALAASRHAPRQQSGPPPVTFRPFHHKKNPPPQPQATRSSNTVTLAQKTKDGTELSNVNYPTLIGLINTKLREANVKATPSDEKHVQIRSVHRHPSNDLVLYTTTPQHADTLRKQSATWLPLVSTNLELHNPIHSIVVHGIPATFLPTDPHNIDMLVAMNPDTLNPAPVFIKWISPNAIHQGVLHSSLRIGFADGEQAKRVVEQKIFFGCYNKKMDFGRKSKPRCMNCIKDGHTSTHCKEPMMCPYCAGDHPADSCELKGMMTSNCTSCARSSKSKDSTLDLKLLFSTTPKSLSHSPLHPTCPSRVAEKLARAAESLHKSTTNHPGQSTPPGGGQPSKASAPAGATPPTASTAANEEEDASMVLNQ